MRSFVCLLVATLLSAALSYSFSNNRLGNRLSLKLGIKKDELGYEIKDRSWFEGLSQNAGASLTDPRAIPPEAKSFAQRIINGEKVESIDETLKLIDSCYDYFAVPFTNGDLVNEANKNTGSAKIFSFAILNNMDVAATLRLFGPMVDQLDPNGTDHPNIRNFLKNGWNGIKFISGLAIVSKLQAYEDTDAALATQNVIAGGESWDINSDSWIP